MTLRARLLLAFAYVLLLAVVALELPLAQSTRDRVDGEVRSQARSQAQVVAAAASGRDTATLRRLAADAAAQARGRVIVVDRAGRVVADSEGRGTEGEDYSTRPEVATALAGRTDQRVRHSDTLDTDLLATAVPRLQEGRRVGAVRVTQDFAARNRAVRRAWGGLVLVGLLVLALGLALGAVLARQIARPVGRLQRATARVAAGDLEARAPVEGATEQRALAQEFNTMTVRLGRLLRAQQEFVADASHQLRTPLAGLRLRLEEAQAESRDPGAREELGHALTEVDRLAQMVGELLELSRVGERELPGEALDLAGAAARAGDRWDGTAAGAGRALAVAPPEAAGVGWCAPADLDRALDALIENALHYGPEASTVTVVAHGQAIDVVDEGAGPAAGEEEAVFERFHRGSAGRAGPSGTGLGLPIARELVRRWGGDVTLERRPGGGAVARVTLPPFTGPSPGVL